MPTGVVAVSKPVKAKKVNAVAAATLAKVIGIGAQRFVTAAARAPLKEQPNHRQQRQQLDRYGHQREASRRPDPDRIDASEQNDPANRNGYD